MKASRRLISAKLSFRRSSILFSTFVILAFDSSSKPYFFLLRIEEEAAADPRPTLDCYKAFLDGLFEVALRIFGGDVFLSPDSL